MALIGISIFFLLFGFSYAAVVPSMKMNIEKSIEISITMEKAKLVMLSFVYIVANVALFVTITD